MATTLVNASLQASLGLVAAWGTPPSSNRSEPVPFFLNQQLSNGTGANQADRWYAKVIQLGSGANTTLDIRSFADEDGTTVTIAEVIAFAFDNSASTTVVTVGASGANQLNAFLTDDTSAIQLRAGTKQLIYISDNGYATGANDKDLKFTNAAGATANVSVWILGRSS